MSVWLLNALRITWVVVLGLVVLFIHLRVARAAYLDTRWVKSHSRIPAKKITAWANLRQEVLITFFQTGLFMIRFWTLFWPMPIVPEFSHNWAIDATTITMLQVLLGYGSYLNDKDRKTAIALLEEDERLYRKGKEIETPGWSD